MAKYTTGGTQKKQKFNKFELVLARKPEGAWWLCKVLQSNDKGKDNFAILFLNTGKILETSIENIRKYTKKNKQALIKQWQKRFVRKTQQVLENNLNQQAVGIPPLNVEPVSSVRTRNQKKLLESFEGRDRRKVGARAIRKDKEIRKDLRNKRENKQQKQQEPRTKMSRQKKEQVIKKRGEERPHVNLAQQNERIDDTTQNFQTLGTKLAIFAKKFYKILKTKGIAQEDAQTISKSLAHFNDSHDPKQTFHQILNWIRSNTPEYIRKNYELI